MDDIKSTIEGILGSKEGMDTLMGLVNSLGLNNPAPNEPSPSPSPSQSQSESQSSPEASLSQILSLVGGDSSSEQAQAPQIDINMIMKIKDVMANFGKGNDNVMLLQKLRPHFSEKRQKKLDDAIKIMQLISVLPMLKDLGIFS